MTVPEKNLVLMTIYILSIIPIFNINWSERSAWASSQHLGGHYFRYVFRLAVVGGTAVIKTPEGVVVGFQFFAYAPN
jgi:hypothetical protein